MSCDSKWNVVVIGCGPAGSTAAYLAARAGLRVALIEKNNGPRYKVCGGCLNERGLSVLEQTGLGDAVRRELSAPLRRIAFRQDRRQVAITGRLGAVVDRAAFDAALAGAAVDAGVRLFAGVKGVVEPIVSDASGRGPAARAVLLQGPRGSVETIESDLVIVADGLGRPSLQRLAEFKGIVAPKSRLGFGLAPSASLHSDGYESSTLSMGIADDGYLGVSRLADGRLCIGAAIDASVARRGALHQWIIDVTTRCGLPAIDGLSTATIQGTRPLTQRPARRAGHRIVLIGDAAGYTEPITGEGMAWGLAAAAATTALALTARYAWGPEHAAGWERTLRRDVYGGQYANRILAAALRHPRCVRTLFAAAAALPTFTTPIVRRINRPQALARIAA